MQGKLTFFFAMKKMNGLQGKQTWQVHETNFQVTESEAIREQLKLTL